MEKDYTRERLTKERSGEENEHKKNEKKAIRETRRTDRQREGRRRRTQTQRTWTERKKDDGGGGGRTEGQRVGGERNTGKEPNDAVSSFLFLRTKDAGGIDSPFAPRLVAFGTNRRRRSRGSRNEERKRKLHRNK